MPRCHARIERALARVDTVKTFPEIPSRLGNFLHTENGAIGGGGTKQGAAIASGHPSAPRNWRGLISSLRDQRLKSIHWNRSCECFIIFRGSRPTTVIMASFVLAVFTP
jgi:hypothetical protein